MELTNVGYRANGIGRPEVPAAVWVSRAAATAQVFSCLIYQRDWRPYDCV